MLRFDLRSPSQTRQLKITLNKTSADISLGDTRVIANVSHSIAAPHPSLPNDGRLEVSMPEIEQPLKSALDTESLCIIPGEYAFTIRIDVHIIHDNGNIIDCALLAAVAAILNYKRPAVDINGDSISVCELDEKHPVALSLRHVPVSTTYSVIKGHLLVDPTLEEEQVRMGLCFTFSNPLETRGLCIRHFKCSSGTDALVVPRTTA